MLPKPVNPRPLQIITPRQKEALVVDTHSRLNSARHQAIIKIDSVESIKRSIMRARRYGVSIAIAGGRHAMGGQQMLNGGILLDTRNFNRVLEFDSVNGLVKVEPGIMWGDLIARLNQLQQNSRANEQQWSIRQKPTGADNISIGGSLASNIHGRGLTMKPFVNDVQEFTIVTVRGDHLTVNRNQNSELFRLAIGGYGMFGMITSITLRLAPRQLLRREVEITTIDRLMEKLENRIESGHQFGDFQFSIDNNSDDFLYKGILSSYAPQSNSISIPEGQHRLSIDQWSELLYLAHHEKAEAFRKYESHYLKTDGQTYHSDVMQLSTYIDDYHIRLDEKTGHPRGTEIISELYVPRNHLSHFMHLAARFLRRENANVIYGTVRLIEEDEETFLAWARESYACVIFNLHTEHSQSGIAHSVMLFKGLIDLAQSFDGSFYLTYHKFADKAMVERSYPQFKDFLKEKLDHDPDELFQSDWYRHYRGLF